MNTIHDPADGAGRLRRLVGSKTIDDPRAPCGPARSPTTRSPSALPETIASSPSADAFPDEPRKSCDASSDSWSPPRDDSGMEMPYAELYRNSDTKQESTAPGSICSSPSSTSCNTIAHKHRRESSTNPGSSFRSCRPNPGHRPIAAFMSNHGSGSRQPVGHPRPGP